MKKLFVLVCVMTLTMTMSAKITWNAKGGVGIATLWDTYSNLNTKLVGKLGVGIEKPLSANWSLMPSFEVAWKGFKVEYWGGSGSDLHFNFLYLQIPIVAAYRINLSEDWNMALKAGPYIGQAVYNHYYYKGHTGEYEIEKLDAGLDVGIDFEHHRFVIGVEAEMGFLKLEKYSDGGRNLAFYATIGWKF